MANGVRVGMSMRHRARAALHALLGRSAGAAASEESGVSPGDRAIAAAVRRHTMTGPLRIQALLDAVDYVVRSGLPGAFVECGVWRGGSVLAMLLKLQELRVCDRDIYLYDTFEGMTAPTDADTSAYEPSALSTWRAAAAEGRRAWDRLFSPGVFNEGDVRRLLLESGYPAERLHFVKGPVEETLPATIPGDVALLRLDTDWYESTLHELTHLYPRLQKGGVLIIDDYGHWDGCRRAVDEYFSRPGTAPVLLQRIDYTGRLAIRT